MDIYMDGCFHVLAIVSSATVNMGYICLFWIMVFPEYMVSSGIATNMLSYCYQYGSFSFRFLRNLHTVLHSFS